MEIHISARNPSMKAKKVFYPILTIILASLLFIVIFGTRVLDVQNVNWLLGGGDESQHYIGWKFFRNSRWMFPYGLMNTLDYPGGCSIIFTDSIPIVAVFFKLLSPLLPQHFQYLGPWGLLSFQLQGLFGYLISYKILKKQLPSVLAAMLFVISPIMINRMFMHTALTSHWLILVALYLLLISTNVPIKRQYLYWFLLSWLTTGIHIYFVPMCGIIAVGVMIKGLLHSLPHSQSSNRLKLILRLFFLPIAFAGGALLHIWLLGGFSTAPSYNSGGLGGNTFNLLSLFYPSGRSDFLIDHSVYPITYPCFNYLGFGVILLMVMTFPILIKLLLERKSIYETREEGIAYAFVFLCTLLISIIPNICIGSRLIVTVPLPGFVYEIMSMFRSNSRFMWVDTYLILMTLLYFLRQTNRTVELCSILLFSVMIQGIDLRTWLREKHDEYTKEYTAGTKLKSPFWDAVAASKKNLYLVGGGMECEWDVADWASDHKLNQNTFYIARQPASQYKEFFSRIANPQDDDVYVFYQHEPRIVNAYTCHYFYTLDGFLLASTNKIDAISEDVETDFETASTIELKSDNAEFPYVLRNGEIISTQSLWMPFGSYSVKILAKKNNSENSLTTYFSKDKETSDFRLPYVKLIAFEGDNLDKPVELGTAILNEGTTTLDFEIKDHEMGNFQVLLVGSENEIEIENIKLGSGKETVE